MARFEVGWKYTGMKSVFTSIDTTDGMFGLNGKSEWKAVPRAGLGQRLAVISLLRRPMQGNPKIKFAMVGSLHKYFFDVQSTGVSSCHVAVADQLFLAVPEGQAPTYVMEFDLPSTPEDDFASTLEKVGGERSKHPYYDLDRQAFTEDVSLSGNVMRIAFRRADQP